MPTNPNPQSGGSSGPPTTTNGATEAPDVEEVDPSDEAKAAEEEWDGDPVARYTGNPIVTRIVTKEDFKRLGARVDEDVVFNRENNHTVPLEGLSKAAVEILDKNKDIKILGQKK